MLSIYNEACCLIKWFEDISEESVNNKSELPSSVKQKKVEYFVCQLKNVAYRIF